MGRGASPVEKSPVQRGREIEPSPRELFTPKQRDWLDLGISQEELDELLKDNPSLYSFLYGYAAERHLTAQISNYSEQGVLIDHGKPSDHDRANKGDRLLEYKGEMFRLESKSLCGKIHYNTKTGRYEATAQIRASDRRVVELSDGTRAETTSALRRDLDIVAINYFKLGRGWEFGFVSSRDLTSPARRLKGRAPGGRLKYLTDSQMSELVSSSFPVLWPVEKPMIRDLPALLEREHQRRGASPRSPLTGP